VVRVGTPISDADNRGARSLKEAAENSESAFRAQFAACSQSGRVEGDGVPRGKNKKKSKKKGTAELSKVQAQLTTMIKTIKNAVASEKTKLAAAEESLREAKLAAGNSESSAAPAINWAPPDIKTNVVVGARVRFKQSSGDETVGTVQFVGKTEFYHGTRTARAMLS